MPKSTQIGNQLERIKLLIPPNEDLKAYLRHTLDAQITSVSSNTSMGIVPPHMLLPTQVYASARMAVELIDQPRELQNKPEGIVDLGVIEWILRPALPINDGLFEPITAGPWKNLPSNLVQMQSQSVCRLDLVIEGYEPVHIGSGFVVGEDKTGRSIIMTNAHVVDAAIKSGWTSVNELKFACDFERYSMEIGGTPFFVDAVHKIHPIHDLALLYVRFEHSDSTTLDRNSLAISAVAPNTIEDLKIGVIGHPAFDSQYDQFYKLFGFGDKFSIKRFSPGEMKSVQHREWRGNYVDVFLHDASTLSGSSGSCILDLNSMKVVGLHFGGWPKHNTQLVSMNEENTLARLFYANGAVPLWMLVDDPFLKEVSFE